MLVALFLVLCAGFGLTACQTKVGAAAMVGDYKITPEDLDHYIDYSVPASDNGLTFPINRRRAVVLTTLISARLDIAVLKAHGGPVTDDERSAAKSLVLQSFGGDAALTSKIKQAGVNPKLEPIYVETQAVQQVLVERLHASSISDVNSAITNANPPVSVSARYGTWSTQDASLVSYEQPSFLLPTPTPAPQPQG